GAGRRGVRPRGGRGLRRGIDAAGEGERLRTGAREAERAVGGEIAAATQTVPGDDLATGADDGGAVGRRRQRDGAVRGEIAATAERRAAGENLAAGADDGGT